MVKLHINGESHQVEDEDMPLLWAIRELAGLTGQSTLSISTAYSRLCSMLLAVAQFKPNSHPRGGLCRFVSQRQ